MKKRKRKVGLYVRQHPPFFATRYTLVGRNGKLLDFVILNNGARVEV